MASLNGTQNGDRFNTPSPQPTHLSVGWKHGHGNRILKDDAPGYIAPAFEGKEKQMEVGQYISTFGRV
jgi:glutamate dehydrogenase